ncbi:MAG: amidohydrolase [Clostridia bacterium]|nr:amidohydrolase [Clostridia bacterium]
MQDQKRLEIIDEEMPRMRAAFDFMLDHPETGYREWQATEYLAAEYESLGYTLTRAGDIPGFYTDLDTGRPGPKILILGELDALKVVGHPHEDPETHAAHACGHNAQSAALLGLAAALKAPGMLDGLSGSIRLCAVPAEELVELDFREELRQNGVIAYYGGKQEFLRRGYFDGCDLAYMIHTGGGKHHFQINLHSNGCILKTATFMGKATHAATPRLGINALDAATLAISGINALRTTFRDIEFCRVHPILTEAGTAVNSVPSRVLMENQVRAASVDACKTLNANVNRAVAAGALAMGAGVHLCDRPGYLPGSFNEKLGKICMDACAALVGAENALLNADPLRHETGCTDMSDLSAVMPAVHIYGSGAKGAGHSVDYRVDDFDCALGESAKAQLLILCRLLENGAAAAKDVLSDAKVTFAARADYFAYLDSIFKDVDAVTYGEDGRISIDL